MLDRAFDWLLGKHLDESGLDALRTKRGVWIWRERVFTTVFLTIVVIGVLAYLPNVVLAVKRGLWSVLVAYVVFVVLVAALPRGISFALRASLGMLMLYAVGLTTLELGGLYGSGRLWLFFFSIMTCLFLGLRWGVAALTLNIAAIGYYLWFGADRGEKWAALIGSASHETVWMVTGITFILLNAVAIISLAALIKALDLTLQRSKSLQEKLDLERSQLAQSNRELEREMGQRKEIEIQRERLIKELRTALDQVKTLHGLLPICSHCKRIRDDKGYWTLIEEYIGEHSEAEFTHSICPDCLKTHYPELQK